MEEQTPFLKRSYTDPELYQRLEKQNKRNTIHSKVSETDIPRCCNKKLISDYLKEIWVIEKNFIFYVIENKVLVYCPAFAGGQQEDPFNLLRQYLQSGERLANSNEMELIIKMVLLLSIAISSLIVVLLSVFIPSVGLLLPAVIIPLLIIATCISVILLCGMSLPGYVEIAAAKRGFHACEERLTTMLSCINRTSRPTLFVSQLSKYLNPTPAKSSPINNVSIDLMDIPPSTSSSNSRGFFAKQPPRYYGSFDSTGEVEQANRGLSANKSS